MENQMEIKYDDPIFTILQNNLEDPDIKACIEIVKTFAGYKSDNETKKAIQYFYNYITMPEPLFITNLRNDPSLEKWYHKLVNGILGDVQNTVSCVHYHFDNLCNIETMVIKNIERYNYRVKLENSCVAIGGTLKWDFEYQAYILAFRRCLDYLARAICTYFKIDYHSFRTLNKVLNKMNPKIIGSLIVPIHEKYTKLFDFVLSEGDRKSTRDKITHYEYVSAGTLNLNSKGFMLAGGGENLGLINQGESKKLTDVLSEKTTMMDRCISEMIFAFVDGMKSV